MQIGAQTADLLVLLLDLVAQQIAHREYRDQAPALEHGQVPAADSERADFLMTQLGPLWYRGYFAEQTDFTGATQADVDLTLAHFGVQRILVGHTIVPTITPLFGGKVIAVQVYPKREADGVHFESLLIRGGGFFRATPDGMSKPLARE